MEENEDSIDFNSLPKKYLEGLDFIQPVDKKFKGETSTVNGRVMETWVNETLKDA
jgi:hypothetical protein